MNPMDQLPSSKFRFLGELKQSTHALLGLLAFVLLVAVGFSLGFHSREGLWLFGATLVVLVLAVLGRYIVKGPEADRSQPSFTFQDNRIAVYNVDPRELRYIEAIVANRHPAPLPSGIIQGSAADPAAIQPITEEQAKEL